MFKGVLAADGMAGDGAIEPAPPPALILIGTEAGDGTLCGEWMNCEAGEGPCCCCMLIGEPWMEQTTSKLAQLAFKI